MCVCVCACVCVCLLLLLLGDFDNYIIKNVVIITEVVGVVVLLPAVAAVHNQHSA